MAMVRKKQDDKYLEALRELITTGGGNRQCFDCGQKGPTYVNMTIGSFVCTRCSGVLRGITPPHRVKSISMATFTQDEIEFLRTHGNDVCAKTWLGLWDPKRAVHQDQRELMIDKYERKRYYLEPASPLKSLTNATNLKTTTATSSSSAAASSSSSSSVTTTTTVSSSSSSTQNSNSNSNTNRSSNSSNNTQQIQLTPPTSQRTTANGLHKTSSTAISRPQHSTPPQNGFSISTSHSHTDAFGLHNGLNTSVGSASTGALSDTSSCASANGFGAEADFVADFGSADIFNATVASSPASSIGSSTTAAATTNHNNGYAKIQPLKMASAAQQQFMNGHHQQQQQQHHTNLQNGNSNNINNISSNGNTENFADFDHAPIYNAAVEEAPNYQFIRKNAIRKKSTTSLTGGGSIIRRNERQLKDILEMDNNERAAGGGLGGGGGGRDYINFNEDDIFGAAGTLDYNNMKLFEDFDTFLTLREGSGGGVANPNTAENRQQQRLEFESDYMNILAEQQQLEPMQNQINTTKFTPLALAAHATAMAVLGNSSHFNTQNNATTATAAAGTATGIAGIPATTNNEKPFNNQWDVWSTTDVSQIKSTSTLSSSSSLPWYSSSDILSSSEQQNLYGSIANCNTGNLKTNQQQYQQQQQQHLPSCTFSSITTSSGSTIPPAAAAATTNTASLTNIAESQQTTTSLPINNNNNRNSTTTNGFNNNNNNNNNNNSLAPAEDRYAALKDLDEQLRESKAVAAQAASIVTANVVDSGFGNPNNGTVNPFATHQHQQQTAVVANPFQNNNTTQQQQQQQNTTQQLFGQMTLIPNGIAAANGFLNAQKAQTNTGFFNYTANGFTNANIPQIQQHQQQQQHHLQQHQQQQHAATMYPSTMQTGPNGCGFGFGTLQQQIASTGTGLTTNTFNNPFAATGALNSNNPFL